MAYFCEYDVAELITPMLLMEVCRLLRRPKPKCCGSSCLVVVLTLLSCRFSCCSKDFNTPFEFSKMLSLFRDWLGRQYGIVHLYLFPISINHLPVSLVGDYDHYVGAAR
jgi:hypothetical protein